MIEHKLLLDFLLPQIHHFLFESDFGLGESDAFDLIRRNGQPTDMHPQHIMHFKEGFPFDFPKTIQLVSQLFLSHRKLLQLLLIPVAFLPISFFVLFAYSQLFFDLYVLLLESDDLLSEARGSRRILWLLLATRGFLDDRGYGVLGVAQQARRDSDVWSAH